MCIRDRPCAAYIAVSNSKASSALPPVFTFSKTQVEEAIWANRVDEVFLNFCNYEPTDVPSIVAQINESGRRFQRESRGYGDWANPNPIVRYLGFGPAGENVLDAQVDFKEPF